MRQNGAAETAYAAVDVLGISGVDSLPGSDHLTVTHEIDQRYFGELSHAAQSRRMSSASAKSTPKIPLR